MLPWVGLEYALQTNVFGTYMVSNILCLMSILACEQKKLTQCVGHPVVIFIGEAEEPVAAPPPEPAPKSTR